MSATPQDMYKFKFFSDNYLVTKIDMKCLRPLRDGIVDSSATADIAIYPRYFSVHIVLYSWRPCDKANPPSKWVLPANCKIQCLI